MCESIFSIFIVWVAKIRWFTTLDMESNVFIPNGVEVVAAKESLMMLTL